MFLTLELATFIVEAKLTNPSGIDREPHVVRLVISLDPLAILGVRLGIPTINISSTHLLDSGSPLSIHLFTYKLFERSAVRQNFFDPRVFMNSYCK